jgi:hypothetical protein
MNRGTHLHSGDRELGRTMNDALPALRKQGTAFSYLPPYSPELHAFEPIFGGHTVQPKRAEPGARSSKLFNSRKNPEFPVGDANWR